VLCCDNPPDRHHDKESRNGISARSADAILHGRPITIRGGGDPSQNMVIEPFVRMGPPPRSLAAEANGCFMVGLPGGANRIQGCGAILRA